MRYLILIALFASQLTAGAADGLKTGHLSKEDHVNMKVEYLQIVLDLSESQTASLRALQETHYDKMNAIRASYQPIMEELKKGLHEIRQGAEGDKSDAKMQAKSLREDYRPELHPMKEAMDAEKTRLESDIVALLSAEQELKFRALQTWREKYQPMKKKDGPHPGHGFGRPEK